MKHFFNKISAHSDEQVNTMTHTIMRIIVISVTVCLITFFHNGFALETVESGNTPANANQILEAAKDTNN